MITIPGKISTQIPVRDRNRDAASAENSFPDALDTLAENPLTADALTFGIEEEFFLVNLRSRRAPGRVPKNFVETCRRKLGDRVAFELKQSQVEIVSPILREPRQALKVMTALRADVADIAATMGLGIIGAGTHPLARWPQQRVTEEPRYRRLRDSLRFIASRDFICGLHIHVAVPVGDRIELMNRLLRWLPLFQALSTSSPFWNFYRTGLFGYRQSAALEWPRAGVPDCFKDEGDFENFIATLVRSSVLKDASEIWWSIRPSASYPTLELRIADSCTRVEDAVAIATLFRCLVSAHLRLPSLGARRSPMTRHLIEENIWRAQRYGLEAEFIDEERKRPVPVAKLLAETLELVRPDAQILDPDDTLNTLNAILVRGTSAHEQIHVYDTSLAAGMTHREALRQVVDWLLRTTNRHGDESHELHGVGGNQPGDAEGTLSDDSFESTVVTRS